MKAIILPLLVIQLLLVSCNKNNVSDSPPTQHSVTTQPLPEKKSERNKINLKDLDLSKLAKDNTVIKGDSILKFSSDGLTLRAYTKDSHLWLYRKYSSSSLILYSERIFFSNIVITSKIYDKEGLLTREIMHLTNAFSLEDLIKLFKKNFNIDITNKKTTESIHITEFINNYPLSYEVHLRVNNDTHYRNIIVDANTGKILSDKIEPIMYCGNN